VPRSEGARTTTLHVLVSPPSLSRLDTFIWRRCSVPTRSGERRSLRRFLGTPTFLLGQTIAVAEWIAVNVAGLTQFDVYPFILSKT
jgi:uncharacterized membrane protein